MPGTDPMAPSPRSALADRLRRFSPALARLLDDESARLMGAGVLVGAASGFAAGVLDHALAAFGLAVLGSAEPSLGGLDPRWALAGPVLGGLVAAVALAVGGRSGRPMGIPDVIEATWARQGSLSLRGGLATAVAAVGTVGGGQSGGREGPIVQLAATVASAVCRGLRLPAVHGRVLVAAGAAAGIAASFNTPIGAAFFALEVVLGNFAMRLFGPVVAATVTGTVVGQALLGDRTALALPAFGLAHPGQLPLYLLLGLLCGAVAYGFKRSVVALSEQVDALGVPVVARPVAAGVVLGGLAALGGTAVMGNGYAFVEAVLSGRATHGVAALVVFLLLKVGASALTSAGSGGAGTFAPTLVVGALTGAVFGTGVAALTGGGAETVGAFGMVGMGAVAAAVSHAPITMALMLFEMTGNYEIVLPLLLAIAVASLVDASVDAGSLYDRQLQARGVVLDRHREGLVMYDLSVADVMRTDAETLSPDASFATLADRMLHQRMDELFVVDDDGRFHGLVNVHDIKGLLNTPHEELHAVDLEARDVPTLRPEQPVAEAVPLFLRADLDDLPVVDGDGRFLGVLRERDVVGAYSREVLEQDTLLVRLEHEDAQGRQTDFFELPPGTMMGSVRVGPPLAGRTLAELDLPRSRGCTVVAAVRTVPGGRDERITPRADLVVSLGDRLVVLGPTEQVAALTGGLPAPCPPQEGPSPAAEDDPGPDPQRS